MKEPPEIKKRSGSFLFDVWTARKAAQQQEKDSERFKNVYSK